MFADACRELLGQIIGPHSKALFNPVLDFDARVLAVRQRYVEFVTERGYGATPKEIDETDSAKSLDSMLEAIREARNQESDEAKEAGTAVARKDEREA